MGFNLVVAVTDGDWFEILRRQSNPAEVNFWALSAANFRALQPGELFLFKLHAPRNSIVGGARSAREMRARISRYRRAAPSDRGDFTIGCRILTQPFFFEERDWIPVPASWSTNIVSFKTYSTSDSEGLALWDDVTERLSRSETPGMSEEAARYGGPCLIRPRLGQGAFRILVTDIYRRRCAVTEERTLLALEAAHIRPYGEGGVHEARNGLLLRRDIHSLFDAGYVTVTPDLRFEVSRRIREEFENGRHYYALHGHKVQSPDDMTQQPDRDALAWHNEQRFNG